MGERSEAGGVPRGCPPRTTVANVFFLKHILLINCAVFEVPCGRTGMEENAAAK